MSIGVLTVEPLAFLILLGFLLMIALALTLWSALAYWRLRSRAPEEVTLPPAPPPKRKPVNRNTERGAFKVKTAKLAEVKGKGDDPFDRFIKGKHDDLDLS